MEKPQQQLQKALSRGLYGIADATSCGDQVISMSEALLTAGVRIIQVRCKHWSDERLLPVATQIVKLCKKREGLCVINDRVQVAVNSGAHGVHLGQGDSVQALKEVPTSMLIGRSTHSLAQVKEEQVLADYLGFGPVFQTSNIAVQKPLQGVESLRAAVAASDIPVVAIGGIHHNNVELVQMAGAAAWAVIGDISRDERWVQNARALCRPL